MSDSYLWNHSVYEIRPYSHLDTSVSIPQIELDTSQTER